jgi:hypothetical protein
MIRGHGHHIAFFKERESDDNCKTEGCQAATFVGINCMVMAAILRQQ